MFYHIVYHVFSICFLKTVLFHHFSTGFAASRSPLRWPLLRKMPVQRSGIWMAGMPKDGDPKWGMQLMQPEILLRGGRGGFFTCLNML